MRQPANRSPIRIGAPTRWIEATADVRDAFAAHLDASMATLRAR